MLFFRVDAVAEPPVALQDLPPLLAFLLGARCPGLVAATSGETKL